MPAHDPSSSPPLVSAVATTGAVAVTPHHLATAAALKILAAGGNAADAAVAANAVQGMVDPSTCGPGGDLFALVHRPGFDAPEALNASGRGGSGLDAAALRSAGHDRLPRRCPAAVTAPGCVDGWLALAHRYGTRSLTALLAPAIHLGEEGFPVSADLAEALERLHGVVTGQASAVELYPEGRPPRAGEMLRRPRLAATLRAIAAEGREALYAGAAGEAITEATGGILTAANLSREHAEWVEPIGIDVFSHRLWTIPPNSQGYLTGAAAWLLEQWAPPGDPTSPAFHHAVVECYRAIAGEGDALVADPGHLPLPAGRLLDPERLRPLVGTLRPDRVVPRSPARPEPGGTAYLAVLDAAGMGVSLIQSNFTGIGSGLSAGGTGVWLHNRGACFSLQPGHPNEAAPGKRPRHTLSPTLWTREGRLALLLGTRGGYQQPQYLLQAAALLFVAGLGPEAAQAQPRWHMEDDAAGNSSVFVAESRMPEDLVAGLRRLGHTVAPGPPLAADWGPVSVVAVAADGTRTAAADPRVATAQAATH
ncbi:MAG: gamma-glutamyltransferase [Actinomycetota bacterium]